MPKNTENMSEGDLFDEGSKAFLDQKWEDSLIYLGELIWRAPTHLKGRELLAMAQSVTGRHSEAIDTYDYLLEDDPDNADYLGGKGTAIFSAGREDEGIILIQKSLRTKNNKEYRGFLIKMRGGPINLLEIKGLGEKHREKMDGLVTIKTSDAMQEIAELCFKHNAMVKVQDVMMECLVTDLKTIEKLLEIVGGNIGIQGNLAQVDDLVLVEFLKADKK